MRADQLLTVTDDELWHAARAASVHSDMGEERLAWLGRQFLDANMRAPGAPGLEVGTREGGSALLCLQLGLRQYGGTTGPLLVTVDPYGGKPYHDGTHEVPGMYDDRCYVKMKELLASWENHVHFRLTGRTFLKQVAGERCWRWGGESTYSGFNYALLDGDHDARTVGSELRLLKEYHLAPGAVVVIDNVNMDAGIEPTAQRLGYRIVGRWHDECVALRREGEG